MSLCTAYQEDLIAFAFLRNGSKCANLTCQHPITSHQHKPREQGLYYFDIFEGLFSLCFELD